MKLIRRFLLLQLIFLLFETISCREELLGYDQAINPIWERNFNVGLTGGIQPIVHDNIVLFASLLEKSQDLSVNEKLIALDKESGDLIWEWNDHFRPEYQHFSSNAASLKPISNDKLAFTFGGRNFCVNLNTGGTVWKNMNDNSTSRDDLVNLGEMLFRTDIVDGENTDRLMEADFNTGIWKPVYEVNGGDSIRQGLQVPAFYFESDGDTIMIFSNTLWDHTTNKIIPRLISYNKTRDSTYYDIQLDDEPDLWSAVDWIPIIKDDMVFLSVDDHMHCRNVKTGELIWKRNLKMNLLSSNFIIEGDRLFTNTEEPRLWCLDTETGHVLWDIPSFGFASLLNYYDHKIIYSGWGLLRIVDADSGAVLAEIKAPSSYKNSDHDFSSRCTVDPETGNIYVTSWTTAYCYPPYEAK